MAQQGWDLFSGKKPAQKQSQHSEEWAYLIVGGFVLLLVAGWVTTSGEAWWTGTAVPWLDEWRPVLTLVAALILLFAVLGLVAFWQGRHARRLHRGAAERQASLALKGKPKIISNGRMPVMAVVTCDRGVHPTDLQIRRAAETHGAHLWGETAQAETKVHPKSGRTQILLTKPKSDEGRDSLERDLETVARQALPQTKTLKVTARDKTGEPVKIQLRHEASFRALVKDEMCESLEAAMTSKLGWAPHTYRMMWDPRADEATLERWDDPLSKVRASLPYLTPDAIRFDALPVGVRDDGSPFLINLTGGRHTLVAGSTGAGKSSLVQGLLRAGAPTVHAGLLQYRGVDPKGGAELGKARALFYDLAAGPVLSKGPAAQFELPDGNMLSAEYQRQLDLLVRAGYDCLMRAYRLGAKGIRQHTPSVEEPAVWVFVDEIALMTTYLGTRQDRELAAMAIAALVTQGRAWGFHLVACLQDPRMKTLEIRNLFPVKIGMRLDRKSEVAMVLGDSAAASGARCDRINKATPGVCYVLEDGEPDPTRNRAAYVTDADIEDMCRRFPAPDWQQPENIVKAGFTEAVGAMVPADVVQETIDGVEALAAKPGTGVRKVGSRTGTRKPRKAATRKRTAPGEVIGDEPATADEIEVGNWIVITEKKEQWEVQVQEVDGTDPVRLVGEGWERTHHSTDTLRRLILAE